MGRLHNQHIELKTSGPLPEGIDIGLHSSPLQLSLRGLNFPVVVSHASHYVKNRGVNAHSATVMAHLDTGASVTVIDVELAKHLGLVSIGTTQMITAGGLRDSFTFTIDLQIPNSTLSPIVNLPVNSCNLGFDVGTMPGDYQNFAVLIGRDIMSNWNIAWNGPLSIVTIND